MFYCLACAGKELDFIENNHGFPFMKCHSGQGLEHEEEIIPVTDHVEDVEYILGDVCEIDGNE